MKGDDGEENGFSSREREREGKRESKRRGIKFEVFMMYCKTFSNVCVKTSTSFSNLLLYFCFHLKKQGL